MESLYCGIIGYIIGSINPAYIWAKCKGFDIRTKGSKNAGASNALILFGKVVGILCALLDIAKVFLAILLTETLFPNFSFAFAITGVGCVTGHVFPFYMKFKGGKGTACLGGMILYFDWRVFLIMFAATIIVVLLSDYLLFMPIVGSATFPIVYGFMKKDVWGALILSVILAIVVIKNIENFKRMKNGTEMRISYLWNPKKEMERMQKELSANDEEMNKHLLEVK